MAVKPTQPPWLDRRFVPPAVVTALAFFTLVPLLWSYGLWDPHEIQIADAARNLAEHGGWWKTYSSRPPLTSWLLAASVKVLGTTELTVRLPLALLGIIAAAATYALGARLRRPRAGLYAAIVLCSSPLFVFQARQLTSDMVTVTAGAVALLGLAGLTWPADGRFTPGRAALDAALALVGLAAGFLSAGLLIGVFVPLAGAALAGLFAATWSRDPEAEPAAGRGLLDSRVLFAAAAALAALVVIAITLAKVYDLVPAQAGHRGLFGKTVSAAKGYIPLLGGAWRSGQAPTTATFDAIIKQVAFGMFPWSALAPLAVLRLALVRRRDRAAWAGLLLLFTSAVAYLVTTIWLRKVGEVRYPALPAIALAVGLMIDDVLSPAPAGETEQPSAAALPLAALFTLAAAVQLARDFFNFPDELVSVHLLTAVKFPTEKGLLPFVLSFGVAFAIAAALGLGVRPRPDGAGWLAPVRRLATRGLPVALGVGYLFGLFLALVFTPRMSQHFSYKNIFQTVFDHSRGAEPLGVMGIPGSGPDYYAHGRQLEKLTNRQRLISFLGRPDRVFAIAPAGELCAVNQAAGTGSLAYHVLDDRNSRYLLLTNRLLQGETDQNPLLTAIRRTPPEHIGRPIAADFEGKIELLGGDLPEQVSHGSTFEMTLYFRVKEKLPSNYKIFVHFDGQGARFQGDHEPIQGRCGTTYWQPGDYIVDRFTVKAGEITHPRGEYKVMLGFFTGSAGRWKNMTVTTGNADSNNRVRFGSIRLR